MDGLARVQTCAVDTLLFHRDDPTHHMFGVLKGEARLRRMTSEGVEMVVHRAGPDTLFAEAALFSKKYHCDGEALAGSEIVAFPKQGVLNLLNTDSAFAVAFCQRMAGQVQRLRAHVELRAIRSAEDRIMAALSLRTDAQMTGVELECTWKSFAQEIGLSHEALYRALRRLEETGRLQRNGRSVNVG